MVKPLLILDLNGTFISRTAKGKYRVRDHTENFLEVSFRRFTVAVWSCANMNNIQLMLKQMLTPQQHQALLFVMDRSYTTPHPTSNNPRNVIKDLTKRVWSVYQDYGPHNTIILDDTPEKSLYNPYNVMHLETYTGDNDTVLLHTVVELLYWLRSEKPAYLYLAGCK